MVENIQKEHNNQKQNYIRNSAYILNYWKTRFELKGLPVNINDIINLYNFQLKENYIIEGDENNNGAQYKFIS